MKVRLTVLSNGDCVSLDNIRSVRIVDKESNRPKIELIYTDGVIFNFEFINLIDAETFRNEIVSIINEFESDIIAQKEAEKLESKIPLTQNTTISK